MLKKIKQFLFGLTMAIIFFSHPKGLLAQESKQLYVPGEIIIKLKSTAPGTIMSAANEQLPDSLTRLNKKLGIHHIQRLKKSTTNTVHISGDNKYNMQIIENNEAKNKGQNIYLLKTNRPLNPKQIAAEYTKNPNVLYAEPNFIYSISEIPNDPEYSNLWGLQRINCETAWDTTKGNGALVAVVDTGVDYTHSDLATNIWENDDEIPDNGIDDDGNGFIDDVRGWDFKYGDNDPMDAHSHGTHCSGTIAAIGNNNIGVIGVAPEATIMPLKGLDDNGSGSGFDLAEAIYYAVDNGAQIISCSWVGEGDNFFLSEAFEYAENHGVVCVVAAGNNNADASLYSPANIDSVITVASIDSNDQKAGTSNYGDKIDLSAPGVSILSTTPSNNYGVKSGTSMACPHVSGVAALLSSQGYAMNEIKSRLKNGVTPFATPPTPNIGLGILNATDSLSISNIITEPGIPSGEPIPIENQEYTYTITQATSSLGSTLEYRFIWGDGTTSEWSTETQATKTWSNIGFYQILAEVRIQGDTQTANTSHTLPIRVTIAQNPIAITTVEQLQNINEDIYADYYLTSDIDATVTATWNDGAGFSPIGDEQNPFQGNFDGNGFTINNLIINRPTLENVGLFGYVSPIVGTTNTIKNVTLANVSITGYAVVGGVIGLSEMDIENIHVTGTITAEGYNAGGIVARTEKIVKDASFSGIITGEQSGGICGNGLWASFQNCSVNNTQITCSSGNDLGGIVGYAHDYVLNNSFYDLGSVTLNGVSIITRGALFQEQYTDWITNGKELSIANYSSSLPYNAQTGYYEIQSIQSLKDFLAFTSSSYDVQLTSDIDLSEIPNFYIPYISGVFDGNHHLIKNMHLSFPIKMNKIGFFGEAAGATIKNMGIVDGTIEGDTAGYVGLLVGSIWLSTTVENCYTTGSVSGNYRVGGLVGEINYGVAILNCYSTADVSGSYEIGGFIGCLVDSAISHCYSSGTVTSLNENSITVAGFIGHFMDIREPELLNNFWDMETSGQPFGITDGSADGQQSIDGIFGKTTTEMTNQATYTGWDFNTTWFMNDYPNLYQLAKNNYPSAFDFDGDGIFDITWKDQKKGKECIWLMKNGQATDFIDLGLGLNWQPIADINNDGRDDIVKKNTDGSLTLLLMNGLQMPELIDEENFGSHPEIDVAQLEAINFEDHLSMFLKDNNTGKIHLWLNDQTSKPEINLSISCDGASEMKISENADLSTADWEPYQSNKLFLLSDGNGTKTVYSQFKNTSGEILNGIPVEIIVNKTTPVDIQLTYPTANISTNETNIAITGQINSPYLKLLVNNNIPQLNGNIFTNDITLSQETTSVSATAIGLNGNITTTPEIIITLDTTPPQNPSISIEEGALLTNKTTVTLSLFAEGATQMRFSNTPTFTSEWEPYSTEKQYPLSAQDGTKTIYVQYRDDALNETAVVSDSIELDITDPVITFTSPTDGQLLSQKVFIVEGTMSEPCSKVSINNQPATLNGNTFSVEIVFAKGDNWLTPSATDLAGNEALSSSIYVPADYVMPKSSPITKEEAYRINCGAEDFDFTEPDTKNWWCKDEYFYSLWRWGYISGQKADTTNPITDAGSLEPIYQHSRYGRDTAYKLEVPNGEYEITLMFAETWFDGPGQRVFDIQLENNLTWQAVDIFAGAGGKNIAYNLTTNITVTDKCLDITFPENAVTDVDLPTICGIKLKAIDVSNDSLLDFMQKKFFWLYWNAYDENTGLVQWGANNWEQIYVDVSSSAITGFALSSYTIGAERGWITMEMAYDRILKILTTYETIQNSEDDTKTLHGLFYHWVWMDSGARAQDSELSTVDSALFILGALQAGEYFKNVTSTEIGGKDPLLIANKADQLYRNMDWEWFTGFGDSWQQQFITMGWKPTVSQDELNDNKYIATGRTEGGYYCNDWWNRYSEGIFVNFLAFGSPTHWNSGSADCWENMHRGWVDAFGYGFIQEPPLFTHQYHHFYYDLSDKSDNHADYFLNSTVATLANRQTCIEDSRYEENIWGLTAAGGPDGKYHIYGGYPGGGHDGTVTPSAAITSIMFTPEESITAAREMYFQYKHRIWGRYGFCDSFNVDQDWRHWAIEGLNLGAMIIAIENYRTGLVKDTFMQNQYVQPALTLAGFNDLDNVSESSFYGTDTGNLAFDGDMATRWASKSYYRDEPPQWIEYDYKQLKTISKVTIYWEWAHATAYKIQISNNKTKWTTVYETTTGDGDIDEITLAEPFTGRYMRIYMTQPSSEYGYSIWECQIETAPDNIALTGTASGDIYFPEYAFDGDLTTRWISETADNQWLIVDLKEQKEFNHIKIHWEAAYALEYYIKISDDGVNWINAYTELCSNGNIDEINFLSPLTARYVALFCTKRHTPSWGNSVWEFEIRNQ